GAPGGAEGGGPGGGGVLGGGHGLLGDGGGLLQEGVLEAVEGHGGGVGGLRALVAGLGQQLLDRIDGFLGGGLPGDQLDTGDERRGIGEVDGEEPFGVLHRADQFLHRDGGGVGADDRVRASVFGDQIGRAHV